MPLHIATAIALVAVLGDTNLLIQVGGADHRLLAWHWMVAEPAAISYPGIHV